MQFYKIKKIKGQMKFSHNDYPYFKEKYPYSSPKREYDKNMAISLSEILRSPTSCPQGGMEETVMTLGYGRRSIADLIFGKPPVCGLRYSSLLMISSFPMPSASAL